MDLGLGEELSHPAGVRGLKLRVVFKTTSEVESHPAGVRGLKLEKVAQLENPADSRTPQGCVD